MRQAHFDDEPTIDTDILDAFQRYCLSIDQTKVGGWRRPCHLTPHIGR